MTSDSAKPPSTSGLTTLRQKIAFLAILALVAGFAELALIFAPSFATLSAEPPLDPLSAHPLYAILLAGLGFMPAGFLILAHPTPKRLPAARFWFRAAVAFGFLWATSTKHIPFAGMVPAAAFIAALGVALSALWWGLEQFYYWLHPGGRAA